jgi:hypothetical protein
MAKVFLVSVYEHQEYDPNTHYALEALKKSAAADPFHVHTVTNDAEEAEIVLFVEMGTCGMFAEVVRAHPVYRRYPEKCFLYDWGDDFWPILPGIYPSLRKKYYSREHTRSWHYILPENPYLGHRPVKGSEKYLASFVGSTNTHSVRESFLHYNHPDIHVMDTSKESYRIRYHGTREEKEVFWQRYADSIGDSLFSLCPRGRGPGSIRLYESMKVGRACIILSDEWVPNDGVDWDSFSIRVPEAEVERVPELLEAMRDRAIGMGIRARQQWETWFSPEVCFHRMTELCLAMKGLRTQHGLARRIRHYRHMVKPANWRIYLRSRAILYRRNKKVDWVI